MLKLLIAFTLGCAAQDTTYHEPERDFRFFLSGGYPFSVGTSHNWTDGQYSIAGGFTYKKPEWPVGLQFDGSTHHFGFNERARAFANADGYMQITAGTANLTLEPKIPSQPSLRTRLLGGIGVYNRVLRTTETRLVAGSCFDPWWGYVPCAGGADVITNSKSQTKFGVNGGAAIGWLLESGVEFFLEFRYHVAFTSNKDTAFLPLLFGFKW